MNGERPYEIAHVPPCLHSTFDGKVPPGLTGDAHERELNFLSRSLASYAIMKLAGCTSDEASASLVDGGGDGGIDAVHFSANGVLWLVQSKFIEDGRGQPSSAEVAEFADGIGYLLRGDFSPFSTNDAWKKRTTQIEAWLKQASHICAVIVYSGITLLNDDRIWKFETIQRQYPPEEQFFSFRSCNLTTVHDWLRGADDGLGIKEVQLEILNAGRVMEPYETIFGLVRLAEIAALQHEHGPRLITANIRRYKGETDVNNSILQTLQDEPGVFFYLNNGLTAYCDKFSVDNRDKADALRKRITAYGFSIVNGAQTLGSIQAACPAGTETVPDGYVFIKVVSLEKCEDDIDFAKRITRSTNFQNRIQPRDFVALDDQHERIAGQLAIDNVFYHYKSGADVPNSDDRNFDISDAASALACIQQDKECGLVSLLAGDYETLWSDEKVYKREEDNDPMLSRAEFLFSGSTSARTIWRAVQTRKIVVDSLIAASQAESGARAEFLLHSRWLVLNLVFLQLRPHQGDDLFLDASLVKAISIDCIDFAEKLWDAGFGTGLVSRKAVGGTDVYEAPTEFRLVFGDQNECKRLRNAVLRKLNATAEPPVTGGAEEGATQ